MNNSIIKLSILLLGLLFSLVINAQNALHFDGTNDRVDCGNSADVQISGTQITLEAWIRPTAFGTEAWKNNIIDKEVWTPQEGFMLRCGAGGKLNFNLGGGGSWNELTSATTVLTLNTWHHVAGTYDGSYMRIYVDGMITDSVAKTVSISSAANSNLIIGDNSQTGRNFNGYIDEVRIWNIARTKSEIQAGMLQEYCGIQPNLKAYYRLNEGMPGGSNSGVTTATNSANSLNNATLTGFALSGLTSNWVVGRLLIPTIDYGGDTITASFCSGGSYTFHGQTYTQAGTYKKIFHTNAGCDSTITLIITQLPSVSYSYIDTICKGETILFNGQSITTPGVYGATVVASNGCDSLVSVIIKKFKPNLDINYLAGGTILQANQLGLKYQWVSCDNNHSVIPGATSREFTPTAKGSYACIISNTKCSDTTACKNVTQITGISDTNPTEHFTIFPNPAKENLTISFEALESNKTISVFNSTGQLVKELYSSKGEINISIGNYSKGLYIIQIKTEGAIHQQKVIFE